MSYQHYTNDDENDDVKIDVEDDKEEKGFKLQYTDSATNVFSNPQGEGGEYEENGKDGTTTNNIITELKDETNNGAQYGFKVNPDQLSELSAELIEEGKNFYKAHSKYKRAFFSELDNEVSSQTCSKLNSIDLLSGESLVKKVEIVCANEANQEKLCLYCI